MQFKWFIVYDALEMFLQICSLRAKKMREGILTTLDTNSICITYHLGQSLFIQIGVILAVLHTSSTLAGPHSAVGRAPDS